MHPKLILLRKWQESGMQYVVLGDKETSGEAWAELEIFPVKEKKREGKDEAGGAGGGREGKAP